MTARVIVPPLRRGISLLVLAVGTLTGCSGNSTEQDPHPSPTVTSPAPTPTPSTVAQENSLAARIPLDGNELRPLHWRLPAVKASDAPAVLAARQATALFEITFSGPTPAEWAGAQLAVEDLNAETSQVYQHVAETTFLPWEKRMASPVWVWIMNIHRESADRFSIHQCLDLGWSGTVGKPRTARDMTLGDINHLTVSRLSHYPDGSRWKVTSFDITGGKDADRYQKQCKAWADTHTTTEGWTLPPEPISETTPSTLP
jgi:hypothetical protein